MKIKSSNKEYKMSEGDCKECGVKLHNFEKSKGMCNECSQENYI